MTFLISKRKSGDLDFENDLLLSLNDFEVMKNKMSQDSRDVESYLDFLDNIEAFGSRDIETTFFEAVFEL
jgi:hypothetical protein